MGREQVCNSWVGTVRMSLPAGSGFGRGISRREAPLMFERVLAALAALAAIAGFALQAWRTWREYRSDHRRPDDVKDTKKR